MTVLCRAGHDITDARLTRSGKRQCRPCGNRRQREWRWKRGVEPRRPVEQRFWSQVDRSGGPDACWEWQGRRFDTGYGQIRIKGHNRGVHRVAWELAVGPIPDGLNVCHHCDHPLCCNPRHLFLGTDADNMQDKLSKGRGRAPRGADHPAAKLSEGQVEILRQRWAKGGASQGELAREFGISQSSVSHIVTGRTWRAA